MGGKVIGEDDEDVIYQLPNGMRWPVPKKVKGLVLSVDQKKGVAPLPKKQFVVPYVAQNQVVARSMIPVMPERVVVEKREEFLVWRVAVTASHHVNQMAPNVDRRGQKRRESVVRTKKGYSLSPEFVKQANRILETQGREAAQEFIRKKKDQYSSR
jgi:hypothetical protein